MVCALEHVSQLPTTALALDRSDSPNSDPKHSMRLVHLCYQPQSSSARPGTDKCIRASRINLPYNGKAHHKMHLCVPLPSLPLSIGTKDSCRGSRPPNRLNDLIPSILRIQSCSRLARRPPGEVPSLTTWGSVVFIGYLSRASENVGAVFFAKHSSGPQST